MSFMMDGVGVLAGLLADVIYAVARRMKINIGVSGVNISIIPPLSMNNIDKRLKKIETAREGLQEALEAVEELRISAEESKLDLQAINASIQQAESEKTTISQELEAIRVIAVQDGTAVRKALGLPTPKDVWKERIVGFILGVLASTVAALIWEFAIKKLI